MVKFDVSDVDGYYDFGGSSAETYKRACPNCGKEHVISTQGNTECCEYTTDIYLRCDCGTSVGFCLPVN